MSAALAIIAELGGAGKTPLEIARELHARQVTGEHGRPITPQMVAGFLRFSAAVTDGIVTNSEDIVTFPTRNVSRKRHDVKATRKKRKEASRTSIKEGASWGRKEKASPATQEKAEEKQSKRKNRWHAGTGLTDELKKKITHLLQHEHLKADEIAKKLGLHYRKVAPFCAMISGYTRPPGEVTVYIDDQGRKITRYPPGYARGVSQQYTKPSKILI